MFLRKIPATPCLFLVVLILVNVLTSFAAELDYGSPSPQAAVASAGCNRDNTAVFDYFGLINQTKLHQPELVELLRLFPKGADIHNHLSGTVMPEDYLAMGVSDGDCYGPVSSFPYTIAAAGPAGTCANDYQPLATASQSDRFAIVQSLSMDHFGYPTIQYGHDQFFSTFRRFGAISGMPWNTGPMLVLLLRQAHKDTVSHVETMISFQSQAVKTLSGLLRQKFSDDSFYRDTTHYPAMYDFLLSVGLKDAVAGAESDISQYVNRTNAILHCGLADRDPACSISYSFLATVNRNSSLKDGSADLAKIFTQTAFSILLAASDRRVVGVNLLSNEDAAVSMQSFATQMQFFSYFHGAFPGVNIALHAGEITPCFVGEGNPALKNHLVGALKAGAKRIGHAVSFAFLPLSDQAEIIGLMKKNNAVAEIMFTSNAQILGVAGDEHPFVQYRNYGIPVVFATDDEGVSHADFTSEWVYGIKKYTLHAADLIRLARESFQHSFIPGEALWSDLARETVTGDCSGVTPGITNPPEPCRSFLGRNARAQAQWDYETALASYLQSDNGKRFVHYLGGAKPLKR